jgi:GNAT superfamily N-acetyltransferase
MSTAGPHIRRFEPADQAAARRLIQSGLAEHFGFADEDANPDLNDIAASYPAQGHLFLIAESGGDLIGTAALIAAGKEAGRIVRVSVARDHRRHGVARALVERLAQHARALGLVRLWVETNDDWADAIGLYVALGFREHARGDGSAYLSMEIAPCNPTGRSA